MKKLAVTVALLLIICFTLYECSTSHSGAKSTLPQDVLNSCPMPLDSFKSWFAGKAITANGLVTPANSIAFPTNNVNCDFYQWSERMFLWITSPTVMQSEAFYTVAPVDSAGNRVLTKNSNGLFRLTSHLAKNGPDRLPVARDNKGKLFEIETAAPGEKDMVKDAAGKIVAVDHVTADKTGTLFVDAAGKTIAHPQAIIKSTNGSLRIVHRFKTANKFIFLDAAGNEVDSEEGQATGDVLMSANHSLVYYVSMVNDVYAWYMSMSKNLGLQANFPTLDTERRAILKYALAHGGGVLKDPNALAMEMKSSWVEASTLSDTGNYYLMNAIIPVYDTTSVPNKWIPKGEKTVRVALVGMHVVGSVAGHPEMIWSTFEHKNNAPMASYTYLNTQRQTITVPRDTTGNWVFNSNPKDKKVNISHMTGVDPAVKKFNITDTIFAKKGHGFTPSNTLHAMPWGSFTDSLTNQQDTTSAASNSEIISFNNTIQSLLPINDVRSNYMLIGATWTANGTAPNGLSYSASNKVPGVAIGTSLLSNTTMETYFQSSATSCYTCHSNAKTPTLNPAILSHMYSAMLPVNPAKKEDKKKTK
jgi:hypothetical protein